MLILFYFPALILFLFLKKHNHYWANPDLVENVIFATFFYTIFFLEQALRKAFSSVQPFVCYSVL